MPENPITTSTPNASNTNKEPISFYKHEVFWFILLSIAVSIGSYFAMDKANKSFQQRHEKIENYYNKNIKLISNLQDICEKALKDSALTSAERTAIISKLDETNKNALKYENDETTNNLLELEMAKIQSEYEVLNLWCALLTVVFLIFSFFSIFKTNEMSRQGSESLVFLRGVQKEAQEKSDNIDAQVKKAEDKISKKEEEIITSFKTGINSLKNEISQLSSQLGPLTTEMEGANSRLSTIKKNIDTVDDTLNKKQENILITLENKISGYIKTEGDAIIGSKAEKITQIERDVEVLKSQIAKTLSDSSNADVVDDDVEEEREDTDDGISDDTN